MKTAYIYLLLIILFLLTLGIDALVLIKISKKDQNNPHYFLLS